MEDHSNRKHAIISPSSAPKWFNCYGAPFLEKDLPDTENEHTIFGTETHEIGQKTVTLSLKGKPYQSVLDKVTDTDKRWLASGYTEFCTDLYARIRSVADATPKYYIEQKVQISEHCWGTLDFGIAFLKDAEWFLVLADLKTGSGKKVEAEANKQLLLYTEGFQKFLGIEEIAGAYLYIYQPTFYEKGYDKCLVSPQELKEFSYERATKEKKILKILDHGKPTEADFTPGSWCTFCKALGKCPVFRNKAKAALLTQVSEMEIAAPPKIKKISMEQMLQAYKMKPLIEDWLSDIEKHLMAEVLKGNKKLGLKVVQGRSVRKWKSDKERVAEGLKKLGVKQPFRKELITIGEVEKLTDKSIEKLVDRTEAKYQLVSREDPRESVATLKESITEMEIDNGKASSKRIRGVKSKKRPKHT